MFQSRKNDEADINVGPSKSRWTRAFAIRIEIMLEREVRVAALMPYKRLMIAFI